MRKLNSIVLLIALFLLANEVVMAEDYNFWLSKAIADYYYVQHNDDTLISGMFILDDEYTFNASFYTSNQDWIFMGQGFPIYVSKLDFVYFTNSTNLTSGSSSSYDDVNVRESIINNVTNVNDSMRLYVNAIALILRESINLNITNANASMKSYVDANEKVNTTAEIRNVFGNSSNITYNAATGTFEFNGSITSGNGSSFTNPLTGNITLKNNEIRSENNTCVQETATTATACGGLSTGSYSVNSSWINPSRVYDGSWTTLGYRSTSSIASHIYVNYTKPSNLHINNISIWKVMDACGTYELSLPDGCKNYPDKIILRLQSGPASITKYACKTLTNWIEIKNSTCSYPIYEEQMIWTTSQDYYGGGDILLDEGGRFNMYNGSLGNSYIWYSPNSHKVELYANSVLQQSWGASSEILGDTSFPNNIYITNEEEPMLTIGYDEGNNTPYIRSDPEVPITIYGDINLQSASGLRNCTQNNATESTDCGNPSNGTSISGGNWNNINNLNDNNFDTYAYINLVPFSGTLNVTYIKPYEATNNSRYGYKYRTAGQNSETVYTNIPPLCWNYSETNISFKVEYYTVGAWKYFNVSCYNSDWFTLSDIDATNTYYEFYEEEMIWELFGISDRINGSIILGGNICNSVRCYTLQELYGANMTSYNDSTLRTDLLNNITNANSSMKAYVDANEKYNSTQEIRNAFRK